MDIDTITQWVIAFIVAFIAIYVICTDDRAHPPKNLHQLLNPACECEGR